MTDRLETTMLLSLLAVLTGSAVGGQAGMFLAVALALNAVSCLFLDKTVLKTCRSRIQG